MNYDNIPKRIKDTGQFCTWKYEQRKDCMTKVPYNPVTGRKASVDKQKRAAFLQKILGYALS